MSVLSSNHEQLDRRGATSSVTRDAQGKDAAKSARLVATSKFTVMLSPLLEKDASTRRGGGRSEISSLAMNMGVSNTIFSEFM
jgi:hypothetical protein